MSRHNATAAIKLAADIRSELQGLIKPPSETAKCHEEGVIIFSLVRGSRSYIELLVHQINGTYANAWYDACLVMIRRLIETLIIEAFEAKKIESKIKNGNGDYFMLDELIRLALAETNWTLGRSVRQSLPKLKDIGNKSAHSRRFIAHRQDIDKVIDDLRHVIQEFIFLAELK